MLEHVSGKFLKKHFFSDNVQMLDSVVDTRRCLVNYLECKRGVYFMTSPG